MTSPQPRSLTLVVSATKGASGAFKHTNVFAVRYTNRQNKRMCDNRAVSLKEQLVSANPTKESYRELVVAEQQYQSLMNS